MAKVNPTVEQPAAEALAPLAERHSSTRRFKTLRLFFFHKPLGAFGAVIIVLLAICAIFGPQIAPYDPEAKFTVQTKAAAVNTAAVNDVSCVTPACLQKAHAGVAKELDRQGPSAKHWFGTDEGGRDTLSRIIVGARRSLGVGIGSLLIGTVLGTVFGLLSAYLGGTLDTSVQRIMDALQAFPPLLFLLLLVSISQVTLVLVTIGIGIVAMPQISRIVRSTVLQVRELPFVEAAEVIGAPDLRIMRQHILPNIWAPVIIVFSIGVGVAILAEAALSFLGVAPVGISWGYMTEAGVGFIRDSPWEAIFAGGAITLAVLGFNLVGDALRDVLDPRLRT